MRLDLIVVAKPQRKEALGAVAEDYLERARGLARPLGLKGPQSVFVPPAKSGDPGLEAGALRRTVTGAAVLLDERGAMLRSEELAELIAQRRDAGERQLSFVMGGADGFDKDYRADMQAKGAQLLAFGKAVWPHTLCRVMVAEQIYRALAILAGHPYHRGS